MLSLPEFRQSSLWWECGALEQHPCAHSVSEAEYVMLGLDDGALGIHVRVQLATLNQRHHD